MTFFQIWQKRSIPLDKTLEPLRFIDFNSLEINVSPQLNLDASVNLCLNKNEASIIQDVDNEKPLFTIKSSSLKEDNKNYGRVSLAKVSRPAFRDVKEDVRAQRFSGK